MFIIEEIVSYISHNYYYKHSIQNSHIVSPSGRIVNSVICTWCGLEIAKMTVSAISSASNAGKCAYGDLSKLVASKISDLTTPGLML